MKFVKKCSYLAVLILFLAVVFQCATVKKVVRTINDIATDYCVYVLSEPAAADQLEAFRDAAPDGFSITIEDICRIQRNVDYFVQILTEEQAEAVDVNRVLGNAKPPE